ncbi:MAG: hypothetical protein V3V75_09690, partial [Thermoguttaceae bacterium]
MALLPAMQKAFGNSHQAFRVVATHFWCGGLSIARIFHVPDVHDLGFALLTGGIKSPARSTIWDWMGRLKATAVTRFAHFSESLAEWKDKALRVSLDSHTVPCWTRKYAIPKGYHTCRNKYMKLEHLYYFYDLDGHCLLRLSATPGDQDLHRRMLPEIRRLKKDTGAARVRVLLDAAASKDEELLLKLLREPGVEVLARAVRHRKYMQQWQAIPESQWIAYEEPDETRGRPPRLLEVANTVTHLGTDETPVRTIVAREYHGRDRKECYHVLYTNVAREHSIGLIQQFRSRQHHEQAYRVGVHDLNLDAITHGYVKDSDPAAPDFDPARITLVGWLKGLAFNVLQAFKANLGDPFDKMQAGSLMRHFLLRGGSLYATSDELIVALDPFGSRDVLADYIEQLNAAEHRIPWLGNRRLRVTFADHESEISGNQLVSLLTPKNVWC